MSLTDTQPARDSSRLLTYGAYASFVPIGIATVLLGPLLPTLSAQWSLRYAQAGALFTVQYVASTCAVALSGVLASRRGFLFPIKAGLILMALGLAFLSTGSEKLGIACIALYGAGLGVAVPAANLMVAAANPTRRSATLNLLNFFWSAGAVACPFLVSGALAVNRIPLLLLSVAAFSLIVVAGIASFSSSTLRSGAISGNGPIMPLIRANLLAFLTLGCLFFLYVGTENAFGGWVASYSKTLRGMSASFAVMTPSFFYASLMVGRWIVPFLLHWITDVKIAQAGLLLAFLGSFSLILSHDSLGIVLSASAAGLGLSSVYPITISLLSRQFESARVGSVMFTLSNIGGGLLPWIVGLASDHFGAIKVGLVIPLLGCGLMFFLFISATPKPAPTG